MNDLLNDAQERSDCTPNKQGAKTLVFIGVAVVAVLGVVIAIAVSRDGTSARAQFGTAEPPREIAGDQAGAVQSAPAPESSSQTSLTAYEAPNSPLSEDNLAYLQSGDNLLQRAGEQLTNRDPRGALASLDSAQQKYAAVVIENAQVKNILMLRKARLLAMAANAFAALGDSRAGSYAKEALKIGNAIGDQKSVKWANQALAALGGNQNQANAPLQPKIPSQGQSSNVDQERFCRHQEQDAMFLGQDEAHREYEQCMVAQSQNGQIQMQAENCVQLGIDCSPHSESHANGSHSNNCKDDCEASERNCDKAVRIFNSPGGYSKCQAERHACDMHCQ